MKASALLACVSLATMLFVSVQPVPAASFTLASGEIDQYGQGVDGFYVYKNVTGSWVVIDSPWSFLYLDDAIEWNGSQFIKLRCFTWFNSTLTGAASTAEGQNYQRHNVTVTNQMGTAVFTTSNFTYASVNTALDPIWYYGYDVILNFVLGGGQQYTVTVTYEVFWEV